MNEEIHGKVYALGDNIDTDQIIPAEYLVYNPEKPEERGLFGAYALSGVPRDEAGLPDGHTSFVRPGESRSDFALIVAGRNFGCGSSREHAPLAIRVAGVRAVVAESYARIFYRNAINGGYLTPFQFLEPISNEFKTGETIRLDVGELSLVNKSTGKAYELASLGDVSEILSAGGIFRYARQSRMI